MAHAILPLATLLAARIAGATPPEPPLLVTLVFGAPPTADQTSRVTLTIEAPAPLQEVRLAVRADGSVGLLHAATPPPVRLGAGERHRQTLAVRIGARGRGLLDARVDATTADGAAIARTATVYVIADDAGVGVGTAGFARLERERLAVRRHRGLITQDEHDRRLEQLLGGGAQEIFP